MKKLILLYILSSLVFFSKAQTPNVFRSSPVITVSDARLRAALNFGVPVVADTLNAVQGGNDSVGLIVYVRVGARKGMWYRDTVLSGGHRWVLLASGIIYQDSTFVHPSYNTDSLFMLKNSTSSLVNIFDRNCGLISPGTVTYDSLFVFTISPAIYILCSDGIRRTSAITTVTLSPSDATFDRRDAIILNSSGVAVLTGTPSATPVDPQISPNQILLTYVTVPAGATTIPCTGITIYDENAGGEWASSVSSVTVNTTNTVNPFHLVYAADVGAYVNGSSFSWTPSSPVTLRSYTYLKFRVRLKTAFTTSNYFRVIWQTPSGNANNVYVQNGQYGFNFSTVGSYQTVIIPISDWNTTNSNVAFQMSNPSNIVLQFSLGGSNGGFYIDYIQLGGEGCITPTPTPSNEEFVQNVFRKPGTDSVFKVITGLNQFAYIDSIGNNVDSLFGKQDTLATTNRNFNFGLDYSFTYTGRKALGSLITINHVEQFSDPLARALSVSSNRGVGVESIINPGGHDQSAGVVGINFGIGQGGRFTSVNGFGVDVGSTNNWGARLTGGTLGASVYSGAGTTSTVGAVLRLTNAKTPLIGQGGSIDLNLSSTHPTSGLRDTIANQIIWKWTTVTPYTSRRSEFSIVGANNIGLNTLFTLAGHGAARLNQYGIGTFTGTAAYALSVDASGNIIETTAGGIGSVTTVSVVSANGFNGSVANATTTPAITLTTTVTGVLKGNGTAISAATAETDYVTPTGTGTLTNKTLTSPIINVGSDATGDVYYRNSGGAFTRLGVGSNGQVLTLASGLPSWAAASSYTDAMARTAISSAYTSGAVPFANGTNYSIDATNFFYNNTDDRLGIGTNSPGSKLEIYDASNMTEFRNNIGVNTNFGRFAFYEGASIGAYFQYLGSNYTTASRRGNLEFSAYGATGKVVVGAVAPTNFYPNGEVGIGSDVAVTPVRFLQIGRASETSTGMTFVANNTTWYFDHQASDNFQFYSPAGNAFIMSNAGGFGIGQAPTAVLHLKAGTATASTAPEKLTAGTLLSTIEALTIEANANSIYQSNVALNRYAMGGKIYGTSADVSNSGTSETDLVTYTTKASTLAATDESLVFDISGTLNDVTATAQLQFYFGGTNIGNTGTLTISSTGGWSARVIIIRSGSTTAKASVSVTTPGASTASYTTTTSMTGLTFTNTNIIKCTGTAGGAGGGTGDITMSAAQLIWWGASNN